MAGHSHCHKRHFTQAFLTQRHGKEGGTFAAMRSDGEGFVAAALTVFVLEGWVSTAMWKG